MKVPYDPKLREAAEEIKAVFKKYDCAGVLLLVSSTHSEFVNHLSPTWSCLAVEENGIRFKSSLADYPSKGDQIAAVEASTHLLTSTYEFSRMLGRNMMAILKALGSKFEIDWTPWGEPDSVPGDGK